MTVPMNALTLLKQDHGNVEELFHRFETASADDVEELARVRDLVIEHLSRHAVVEEHHAAKMMLSELEKLAPTHERFRAKFTVLIENIRHHVKEEEEDMFPLV